MKYFYDTEFLEDGSTIDLISIGIVAEDGREYYAVSNEFDTYAVSSSAWLMENVMSLIYYEYTDKVFARSDRNKQSFIVTDKAAKSRAEIASNIEGFISGTKPELWAWYGAYDHVALCQLWGRMLSIPANVPKYTNEIMTLRKQAGNPYTVPQKAGNHNALEDARYNKVRYDNYVDKIRRKGIVL